MQEHNRSQHYAKPSRRELCSFAAVQGPQTMISLPWQQWLRSGTRLVPPEKQAHLLETALLVCTGLRARGFHLDRQPLEDDLSVSILCRDFARVRLQWCPRSAKPLTLQTPACGGVTLQQFEGYAIFAYQSAPLKWPKSSAEASVAQAQLVASMCSDCGLNVIAKPCPHTTCQNIDDAVLVTVDVQSVLRRLGEENNSMINYRSDTRTVELVAPFGSNLAGFDDEFDAFSWWLQS